MPTRVVMAVPLAVPSCAQERTRIQPERTPRSERRRRRSERWLVTTAASEARGRERVAVVEVPSLESAAKPADAHRGRAMGEALRADGSPSHLLELVVTDGGGGGEAL